MSKFECLEAGTKQSKQEPRARYSAYGFVLYSCLNSLCRFHKYVKLGTVARNVLKYQDFPKYYSRQSQSYFFLSLHLSRGRSLSKCQAVGTKFCVNEAILYE